jgi:CrcB protein
MPVAPWLLIGIGGFFGAIARHFVDRRVGLLTGCAMPWGTLLINVGGSFVAGVLVALIVERTSLSPGLRAPLVIGFLGAYTTFSTWMLQSWQLIEQGSWTMAMLNVGGAVVLGMVAVTSGVLIGRAI